MRYKQFQNMYRNRNQIFGHGYNSADGTTTDTSTDTVITRDPNNYLVPKINGLTVTNTITIAVGVLAIIILLPMAIKQFKSL